MSCSGMCSGLYTLNRDHFPFGWVYANADFFCSSAKKKLCRRCSQTRISYSDQIPKELIPSRLCVPRQLWVFYWRFWRLDHLFPNASDGSVCLLLSRMHTCPREGSQTCNKGRITDLKIAAYTCRLTFSQPGRRWIQWLHQMSPRGCCEHKAD